MQSSGKIKVVDLNPLLTCILCGGYYIDATTIVECLHSFCQTCIVRYLQTNKYCPICEVQVHKTRPLVNIRSDQTLQDIVYKVVPGLFKNEMKRRRDFYFQHKEANVNIPASSEKRGEVLGGERLIFTPEDVISVSLEYCPPSLPFPPPLHPANGDSLSIAQEDILPKNITHRRYLRCPGAITVLHLKKLLLAKYELHSNYYTIDIMYKHDYLRDEYTLIDLAYIYAWRRISPLRLFYKISEKSPKKVLSLDAKPTENLYLLSDCAAPSCTDITSAPAPSVAAAPTSQVHLQRHQSPPPSPQMAVEPDHGKVSKPNCAALPNGQQVCSVNEAVVIGEPRQNGLYLKEKISSFYKNKNAGINLAVKLQSDHRLEKRDLGQKKRSIQPHVTFQPNKVNGLSNECRTSILKQLGTKKES